MTLLSTIIFSTAPFELGMEPTTCKATLKKLLEVESTSHCPLENGSGYFEGAYKNHSATAQATHIGFCRCNMTDNVTKGGFYCHRVPLLVPLLLFI